MKKLLTITLFFLSFTVGFASCNKNDDCKPGTPCTDTYSDGVTYSGLYDDDCDCIPTSNNGGGGGNTATDCYTLCENDNGTWDGHSMQGTICVCDRTNTGGGGGGGTTGTYSNPFGFQLAAAGTTDFPAYIITKVTMVTVDAAANTVNLDCVGGIDPIAPHRPNTPNLGYQTIAFGVYRGPIIANNTRGVPVWMGAIEMGDGITSRKHAGDLATRQTNLSGQTTHEVALVDKFGTVLGTVAITVQPVTVQIKQMPCYVGVSPFQTPYIVDYGQ